MNTGPIVLASNNLHKYHELCAILPAISILRPTDFSIDFHVIEGSRSFHENAFLKAATLLNLLRTQSVTMPVIADDSGIAVEALAGRPGVESARYGEEQGIQSDEDRTALLLKELADSPNRAAHYVCAMVLMMDEERFVICQDTWRGNIAHSVRIGKHTGFGYDPVFIPPEKPAAYQKWMHKRSTSTRTGQRRFA